MARDAAACWRRLGIAARARRGRLDGRRWWRRTSPRTSPRTVASLTSIMSTTGSRRLSGAHGQGARALLSSAAARPATREAAITAPDASCCAPSAAAPTRRRRRSCARSASARCCARNHPAGRGAPAAGHRGERRPHRGRAAHQGAHAGDPRRRRSVAAGRVRQGDGARDMRRRGHGGFELVRGMGHDLPAELQEAIAGRIAAHCRAHPA